MYVDWKRKCKKNYQSAENVWEKSIKGSFKMSANILFGTDESLKFAA